MRTTYDVPHAMADIVLSYARDNQQQAASLAHALEQAGWSVWWDRAILPGTSFEPVIEAELSAARCVVLLWSAAARQSNWVRDEASLALSRGVLVSVLLDDSELPLGFRQQQTVSLAHWSGSTTDPAFTLLTQGIAKVVAGGGPPAGPRASVGVRSTASRTPLARGTVTVVALGVLIAVGAAIWASGFLLRSDPAPARDVPTSPDRPIVAASSQALTVPAHATVTLAREQVTLTILSGTLERVNADTRALSLHIRFANNGTRWFYRTYYSSLRLLIDGVPRAPRDPPIGQVEVSSVDEFDYRFDVPATATHAVLRVTHDDQEGEIALNFAAPGR
jgi:hypothetical protein